MMLEGEIHVSVLLPGGDNTDDVFVQVNECGTDNWWDFDDDSWKSVGWTTPGQTMTLIDSPTHESHTLGPYAYGKILNLNSNDCVMIFVRNKTKNRSYTHGMFIVP